VRSEKHIDLGKILQARELRTMFTLQRRNRLDGKDIAQY